MTVPAPMLTARTVVLAKKETTTNSDALPTAASNAFLVSAADVKVDTTTLERNNYRQSLSPAGIVVGRKLASVSFTHEIKGSGSTSVQPKIASLLEGCGMAVTQITAGAANQIDTALEVGVQQGPDVSWGKTTVPTKFGAYKVTVVAGGASGAAKVRVSQWNGHAEDTTVLRSETFEVSMSKGSTVTAAISLTDPEAPEITIAGTFHVGDTVYANIGGIQFSHTVVSGDTNVAGVATALAAKIDADSRLTASALAGVITIGFASGAASVTVTTATTAVGLGNSGAEITPTWSGNLVEGDSWIVHLYPVGYIIKPISENFNSLTLYVYYDGALHRMTGCMGTVSFTGEAGNYASASFTFTGQYNDPEVADFPDDCVYEATLPPQVEVAQLNIDGSPDFCAQSFTVDMANTITPRDCINGTDGYDGVRLTARAPTGSVNPEAQLPIHHPFWNRLADADMFPFHVRIGSEVGNTVHIQSDSCQYSGLAYGDRNGIRTIDASLKFSAFSGDGNDEVVIVVG